MSEELAIKECSGMLCYLKTIAMVVGAAVLLSYLYKLISWISSLLASRKVSECDSVAGRRRGVDGPCIHSVGWVPCSDTRTWHRLSVWQEEEGVGVAGGSRGGGEESCLPPLFI